MQIANIEQYTVRDLLEMIAADNTETSVTKVIAAHLLTKTEPRARVLVTVQGGSADVQTVGPVDYELLDFDNLEAEGLNFEERDARYQEEARWLETGELPPDHDDGESDIADAPAFLVRHDLHGFYVCTPEEAQHEDAGNPSAGFDGRPHYADMSAAQLAASDLDTAAKPCQHFGDTKDGHCVACGFDLSKLV
jgi:hypothetical protein